MKTIKAQLDKFIKDENLSSKFYSEFCTLDNISEDCPWKKYETYTPQAFIQETFGDFEKNHIKRYQGFFCDFLANIVTEISFVKLYLDDLEREEWIAIYQFENFGIEDKPLFALGGSPIKNLKFPDELKQRGWEKYPDIFSSFWQVHSFFLVLDDHNGDFELGSIRNGDDLDDYNSPIKHPKNIELIPLKDDCILEDILDLYEDFYEDLETETDTIEQKHIEMGIPFAYHNACDVNALMKDDNGDFHMLYICHDDASYYYFDLEEYIIKRSAQNLEHLENINHKVLNKFKHFFSCDPWIMTK